jgi:hypothetical protein
MGAAAFVSSLVDTTHLMALIERRNRLAIAPISR